MSVHTHPLTHVMRYDHTPRSDCYGMDLRLDGEYIRFDEACDVVNGLVAEIETLKARVANLESTNRQWY